MRIGKTIEKSGKVNENILLVIEIVTTSFLIIEFAYLSEYTKEKKILNLHLKNIKITFRLNRFLRTVYLKNYFDIETKPVDSKSLADLEVIVSID